MCFGSALLWIFAQDYFVRRYDPSGWIMDRELPAGPQVLALLGLALFVCALFLGIVKIVRQSLRH
jgi:hypothetical protein